MTFKKLNDAQITTKCVELGKCLIGTSAGLVNYDMGITQTTGDAARFAVSIRNRADLLPRESLAGISSALKVDFRVVEGKIIPLYETLGWIEMRKNGSRIESISENIPPTQDVLSTLGKMWREEQPTVIEEASITSMAELSKRPYSKEALASELSIKENEFETMFDYGDQAGYLGKFTSEENESESIWTPLYWSSKSEDVIKFLKKQAEPQLEKIGALAEDLSKYPGTPDDKIDVGKRSLVDAGIAYGFFPAVQVVDRQRTSHEYVFSATPQFDVEASADLFEKARMIVSCIRHGQYHAEVTKILYPRSILRAMRTSTMKPHPYADVQYAVLVLQGIVRLEQAETRYGKAFKVVWVDTPENNLAADIADQLLRGEEIVGGTYEDLEARKVLVQGVFSYSSEQRRLKTAKRIVAKREFDRLLELSSGVRL